MGELVAMLLDGPCLGSYDVARAPQAMRATVRRATGDRYVLDLVDDVVEPGEDAHLYRRDGGVGFACGRGGGYRTVSYHWVGPLDAETGEVTDPKPEDREWWEAQRRLAIAAWIEGREHRVRDRPAPATAPTQGALF